MGLPAWTRASEVWAEEVCGRWGSCIVVTMMGGRADASTVFERRLRLCSRGGGGLGARGSGFTVEYDRGGGTTAPAAAAAVV